VVCWLDVLPANFLNVAIEIPQNVQTRDLNASSRVRIITTCAYFQGNQNIPRPVTYVGFLWLVI
jgi:hypothetical protein